MNYFDFTIFCFTTRIFDFMCVYIYNGIKFNILFIHLRHKQHNLQNKTILNTFLKVQHFIIFITKKSILSQYFKKWRNPKQRYWLKKKLHVVWTTFMHKFWKQKLTWVKQRHVMHFWSYRTGHQITDMCS